MQPKRIKVSRMITKSAYAKKIGRTPAAVDGQIKRGQLQVIKFTGGEIIYLNDTDGS